MTDRHADPDAPRGRPGGEAPTRPRKGRMKKPRANMHEGIGVWADCCSCEAEPRWAALAEEMGIDLGDYEDWDDPPKG